MQTTLLGIAIALILALVAALVGPLLIDWGNYRPLIESEASRVVGARVRIAGAIDGRLLPSPRLTLHDVTVGQGKEAIRAGELTVQFALTPLMRGEWQAEEMRVGAPELTLALDADGRLRPPNLSFAFEPDALTVQRLQVEGGRLVVEDAANARTVTIDNVFFNGRARSLVGPFNGSGSMSVGGAHYSVDLATGRYNDGGMKLRLGIQPADEPFGIETDGTLAFDAGKPTFAGELSLGPPAGLGREAKPWHVTGKLTAGAKAALLQNLQFVYGKDNEALKLTGSVRLDIGRRPALGAELTTARLDLDRMLGGDDGARPTPAAALRRFAQWSGGAAFRSSLPIQIGLSVNEVVLGGASLQNVGGDFNTVDGGWNLQKLEFRAPGFSQVVLSGRLAVRDDGVSFAGPAAIEATDPKALLAWWQGAAAPGGGGLKPVRLRGDLTIGTERIAVAGLTANFDGKDVTGALTYDYASAKAPSKLAASLAADDVDLDAVLALGRAIAAGSNVEGPQTLALEADLRHATLAGFGARDVKAAFTYGRDGLDIESLSVADFGGARFAAQGHIRVGKTGQNGSLTTDLAAPDMKPVLAVLARFAPRAANALAPAAATMSPANLHARMTISDGAPPGDGKLSLSGTLGKARISFAGSGKVDLDAGTLGATKIDARLDTDDGGLLASMLRLDGVFAVGGGPGSLRLAMSGDADRAMRLDAKMTAAGLDAAARGSVRLAGKPGADLDVTLTRADAAPLRDGAVPLPVTYASHAALAGDDLTLSNIRARIGASQVRGTLTLRPDAITHVGGDIEIDSAEAPPAIAAAIGLPEANDGARRGAWSWSSEPFGEGLFGRCEGDVVLRVHRLELAPHLLAREFSARLRFAPDRLAAEEVTGTLAGGALAGRIGFVSSGDGLTASAALSLTKADAAALVASGARPPLSGTMGLDLTLDGSGLSPAALVGSLSGAGKVTLDRAQLAGLDPRAFDAVTRAVDQGVPIETARISNAVARALESGQLAVQHAEGELAVAAGQLRLRTARASGEDADVTMSGTLDLTSGALDGRLVLSGAALSAGTRPDIYMALKGTIEKPTRSIDVSALTGWLTLRAVDNEARKLKAAEEAAAKARAAEEAARRRAAEDAARKRAAEEAAAKARAAAEAAAIPSATPIFPPVHPPPMLLTPSVPAPLPPPVSVEALPQPPALR